jgi:RNA polymerase sigma factor (sigma-70 family)
LTQFLHRLAVPRADLGATDGELLRRFADRRDEMAFLGLVHRHGPLVWGVCRRLLGNEADAEDAFQATFLILVRRAGSIRRPGLLGNWLYGVAYRTACKARAQACRRRKQEQCVAQRAVETSGADPLWADLRPILDEEVSRLPDKYRAAFVLCYLQGRTNEEAARLLACPKGTILSRLARARQRLRFRLARRGLAVSSVLLALARSRGAAEAAVPPTLERATVEAGASVQVSALAEGVLRAMFVSRLKTATLALLLVAGAAAGAAWWTSRPAAAGQDPPKSPAREAPPTPAGRWGDLKGRFVYDGKPPVPKKVDISRHPDRAYFEKAGIEDESLLVAKDGGLANVLVYLTSPDVEVHPDYRKTADAKVACTLKDGRFQPHFLAMRVGQTLVFSNAEVVAVHVKFDAPNAGDLINLVLKPGEKAEQQLRQSLRLPGVLHSNIHPWMRGYLLVRPDPYTAVSSPDGTFAIRKLPVGKLEFRAWHERSGNVRTPAWKGGRFTVTIREGENDLGTVKLDPHLFEN